MNFENIFINRLGDPVDINALRRYLSHLHTTQIFGFVEEYCENHHVLPRSIFSEYTDNPLNLVRLSYNNHYKAHVLLAEAYPIHEFVRPLNFMANCEAKQDGTYQQLWSAVKKDMWANFSEDRYNEICEQMSVGTKRKYDADPTLCQRIGDSSRKRWKSAAYRSKMHQARIESWTTSRRKWRSCASKQMWEDRDVRERITNAIRRRHDDPEYKQAFCEKMGEVNRCPMKRDRAGAKIKRRWQNNADYRKKMATRRTRPKHRIEVTFPDGNSIVEVGFEDIIQKYNFNATLVRKFMNTDILVETKSKRKNAQNTVNHKFRRILEAE